MPVNAALASEQWNRFTYCRDNGHLDFVAKADKCENYFVGNQWLEADLALLRGQKRPALTINKILSTISTILGEQIFNRSEILFRPKSESPAEVAEALTKIWKYISQQNQLPWVRSDVFCDGIVNSRGFFDVRLKFDDSMEGEIELTLLNRKNVVIDPDAEEYDPDKWGDCFITKWMTPADIELLYSKDDAEHLKAVAGSAFLYGYDSIETVRDRFGGRMSMSYNPDGSGTVERNIRVLERQHRKLDKLEHFVDIRTGDMRPIPHSWDRNRIAHVLEQAQGQMSVMKKLVKRIRWTVTADNVVLHDDWSPYKHFTVVPYFPYFRHGNTVGIVENLLGPQEILNKTSSQELHVINTTANSGWVIEEDSLTNMTVTELESVGATTGLVIEHKKGSLPPTKILPNQVPTGLDRVTYKAEEHIKSISGVSDSMQGFDREDVAAKAIAYKQQRGSVNLTKPMDNLERTDFILARNVLDIVQEFYTEPRIINIIKDDATHEQETLEVNQPDPVTGKILNDLTIGEYDIIVTSTPHRATLEDSQFEQARALKELGVPIPDSVLIENSRLMRKAEIIKQMAGDQESPEAQARAQRQQRAEEAEVAKLEAEAQKTSAEAQAKAMESQGGDQGEMQKIMAEVQAMREEAAMKQEEMAMKMQLEREKLDLKVQEMQQKLQLQAQEHQQQQAFKAQDHAQNMQLKEQQAEQQAAAQRAQQLRSEAAGPSSATTQKE
jgi:hypothetical protein